MKNYMNNRLVVAAIALLLSLALSAQEKGDALLHQYLTEFAESGEYNIHRIDSTNPYVRAYRFSEVFGMEGISDPMFLFESLCKLDRAFYSEASLAQEIYLHNANEGDSPLTGIRVNIGEKPIIGRALSFLPGSNVRLLSFNKPDGMRHCFLLVWSQYLKRGGKFGSSKGQTWYMNGEVYEFEGKKPKAKTYLSVYQPKASQVTSEGGEATHAATYDDLLAKVEKICQIYNRETEQGRTSAVIVLNKLCNSYNGKLSKKQYDKLTNLILPLIASTKNEGHESMLCLSCATLYQKSEGYEYTIEEQQLKEKQMTSHYAHTRVTMANLSKMVTFNSMLLSDAEQVECVITGHTELDASCVTLRRIPQMEGMGEYPVEGGQFNIRCKLPMNEIIEIISKDGRVRFVVDGKPIEVDLTNRTVKSSTSSQPTNDFLQNIRRMELQMWNTTDTTERDSILSTLRGIYKDGIIRHPDNIISAFSLFKSYSEMNVTQLKPYMDDSYVLTNHPLLAPVHEYYEGLMKRNPGTDFHDVELKDPQNIIHPLSEYLGKGYVLLHFWNSREADISGLQQIKSIYETCHPKGLQVISIALNSDNYPPGWRDEIEKRQLKWTQLWGGEGRDTPSVAAQTFGIHSLPETVLLSPDGKVVLSPATIDEMKEVVNELLNN